MDCGIGSKTVRGKNVSTVSCPRLVQVQEGGNSGRSEGYKDVQED